ERQLRVAGTEQFSPAAGEEFFIIKARLARHAGCRSFSSLPFRGVDEPCAAMEGSGSTGLAVLQRAAPPRAGILCRARNPGGPGAQALRGVPRFPIIAMVEAQYPQTVPGHRSDDDRSSFDLYRDRL